MIEILNFMEKVKGLFIVVVGFIFTELGIIIVPSVLNRKGIYPNASLIVYENIGVFLFGGMIIGGILMAISLGKLYEGGSGKEARKYYVVCVLLSLISIIIPIYSFISFVTRLH